MQTSNKIGDSFFEIVESIVRYVNSFDVEKLLYAIDKKRFDKDTIEDIRLDIQEQNAKLSKQKKHLFDYTKDFNKVYTHENNKFVEHSKGLLYRMNSGVGGIRRQVKKFCLRSSSKLPKGASEPKAIERTLLAAKEYMADLFGLESYPECVKELFVEMVKFYNTLMECITEARRSLEEEKATKKNNRKCLELLIEAQKRCQKYQRIFVKTFETSPELKEMMMRDPTLMPGRDNPVMEDWRNCGATEAGRGAFASRYFHNCTPDDVGRITLYKTMTEADGDTDIFTAMTLFNCSRDKALSINRAIRNFDSLLPDRCKRDKIPALHLYVFMRWCSPTIGYNAFLGYFNKRYKAAGGKHETIKSPSALSGANTKMSKTSDIYEGMMAKLQEMFPETQLEKSA